jgi:hypothetical protein
VKVRQREAKSSTNNSVEQEQPKWADINIDTTKDAYEATECESGYEEGDSVSTSIEKRIDRQIRKGRQIQNVRFTPGEAMSDKHSPMYSQLWEPCKTGTKRMQMQKEKATLSDNGQSNDLPGCRIDELQLLTVEKRLSARSDTTIEYPELEFVYSSL